jgi:hypothetical protein
MGLAASSNKVEKIAQYGQKKTRRPDGQAGAREGTPGGLSSIFEWRVYVVDVIQSQPGDGG